MIEYNGQKVEKGYVVFGGIYIDTVEVNDSVLPHNEQTWELYNKGLSSLANEIVGDSDYLEGVQVDKDKMLAQWFCNGRVKLVEIKQ